MNHPGRDQQTRRLSSSAPRPGRPTPGSVVVIVVHVSGSTPSTRPVVVLVLVGFGPAWAGLRTRPTRGSAPTEGVRQRRRTVFPQAAAGRRTGTRGASRPGTRDRRVNRFALGAFDIQADVRPGYRQPSLAARTRGDLDRLVRWWRRRRRGGRRTCRFRSDLGNDEPGFALGALPGFAGLFVRKRVRGPTSGAREADHPILPFGRVMLQVCAFTPVSRQARRPSSNVAAKFDHTPSAVMGDTDSPNSLTAFAVV